jgi:tetratricopeptide (TPR) repeat protein
MSFLDFFKTKKQATPSNPAVVDVAGAAGAEEGGIKVADKFGQQFLIPRKQWQTEILQPNLEKSWNNPDALYNLVVQALSDKFPESVLDAAIHLSKTDTDRQRGLTIAVVTYLELGRNHEAQVAAEKGLAEFPQSAYLMTNLAKAFFAQGKASETDTWLKRGLEIDPNQDLAFNWFVARKVELVGEHARNDAYLELAKSPLAWRPQLWMARDCLANSRFDSALTLYKEVLARANPLPSDVFMQISGDLGNAGQIDQILPLLKDRYDINAHGIQGGNNLLKTYFETKNPKDARVLLAQLYRCQRPDWKETLVFWDGKFDALDKNYGLIENVDEVKTTIIELDRPVWARRDVPLSDFSLGGQALQEIIFVSGSATTNDSKELASVGKTDIRGSFTRGAVLVLAERLAYSVDATVKTWTICAESGGFILSGSPWTTTSLPKPASEHAVFVFSHLNTNAEQWTYDLCMVDANTQQNLCSFTYQLKSDDPGSELDKIFDSVLDVSLRLLKLNRRPHTNWNEQVTQAWGNHYISYCEKALAIATSADKPDSLYQVRSIIDQLLLLSVSNPTHPSSCLMFMLSLNRLKDVMPDMVAEFESRAKDLIVKLNISKEAKKMYLALLAETYPKAL